MSSTHKVPSKSISLYSFQYLGTFLSPKDDVELYEDAVAFGLNKLYEKKINGHTLLKNLFTFQTISDELMDHIQAHPKNTFKTADEISAYASLILFACIGRHSFLKRQSADPKTSSDPKKTSSTKKRV